jgi:hypothetical protein
MNSPHIPSIRIDNRHAGGNIRVLSVEEKRVVLEQELRDTSGWWFYWNFAAWAASPRTATFEFANGEVIGPWGPAVSEDGVHWRWLGASSLLSRNEFRYTFQHVNERVFFCFCIPYQLHHFERYYARIAGYPNVKRGLLTESELLKPVPLLTLGNGEVDRHMFFTARHHACESTPLYVLEGLIEALLTAESSPVLEQYLVHFIPFIDIDGVENGDQGKSRIPHDHNRDYTDTPIYRSTTAMINYAKGVQPEIAIDFHGPFKWGERNDVPFFVNRHSPLKEEVNNLSGKLEQISGARSEADAIRHKSIHNLSMGEDWNQPNPATCASFFERSGARLACSFEFPYFGSADAAPIAADNSRRFGHDFARALEQYVESID